MTYSHEDSNIHIFKSHNLMGRQKHEVVIKMEAQWETHLIVNNHFIYSYYLIIFYEIWCMQLNQEMQITRDLCMQFRVIQKACDITIF